MIFAHKKALKIPKTIAMEKALAIFWNGLITSKVFRSINCTRAIAAIIVTASFNADSRLRKVFVSSETESDLINGTIIS